MDIGQLIISQDSTIKQALKQLDDTAKQILFVVNQDEQFVGTLSDGDIRRALLNNKDLSHKLHDVVFRDALKIEPNTNQKSILQEAKKRNILKIPVLNGAQKIIKLYEVEEDSPIKTHANAVVIMAGGLGTRLRPLTNRIPKPLLPVADTPILERIIAHCAMHGFNKIYLAVNYKSDMIKDYFGDGKAWGVCIEYLEETERCGTAGALKLLDSEQVREPFFVMNGDLLTNLNLEQMLGYHLQFDAKATIAVKDYDYQVPYGVIKTDNHQVVTIEEKPTYRFFVSAGIYVLNHDILKIIPEKTHVDMPELFNEILKEKGMVASFPIHEYWLDIGQMEDYQRACESPLSAVE